MERTTVAPGSALNAALIAAGTAPLFTGVKLADLLRRPQVDYGMLAPFDEERLILPSDVCEQVEISIKYEGYIRREEAAVEQMRRMERRALPPELDYRTVRGLRLEAVDKLEQVRPVNIAQASRISGVNPADISVLLIYLESKK